jgi:transcriptional regulator with XRE-family HTH domain
MSNHALPPLPEAYAFASALIKARDSKGFTQKQLSDACGISLSAIKAYESGRNLPGARELREICQAVQVSPNMMLFGVDAPFGYPSTIDALLGASDKPENGHNLASQIGLLTTLTAPEERDAILTLATSLAIARHGEEVVRNTLRAHDALLAATFTMMKGTAEALKSGTEIDPGKIVRSFENALQDQDTEPSKLPKK